METQSFYKYQGTGNDFVVIDDRNEQFPAGDHQLINRLCHRKFGVGADGLMLLQNDPDYDFRMVYFNADGKEGSMCGNGGRCLVQFAYDLGVIGNETRFIAVDGPHEASVEEGLVHLKMSAVEIVEAHTDHYFLDTGSPHYVQMVKEDLANYPVVEAGRAIRYNEVFKEVGTNVNFVKKLGEQHLFVRTYERGVEDETYSCGTGVTACAIAAFIEGMPVPIDIKTLGGNLSVTFKASGETYSEIYLIGPATFVFKGEVAV
jgi:diaminopimelate epimerase